MATNPVCRIIADSREPAEGVPALLSRLGAEVEIRALPVGDYLLGSGRVVERKTVPDLHLSLQRGRLWRQIAQLRDCARFPYLLVEGGRLDLDGGISPNAIRGACLAVVGLGVPMLFSSGREDSAHWLWLLARRSLPVRLGRDRPVYAQRLKPRPEQVREAILASVPGISVAAARALLGRFGSIHAVVAASERDWREVPGIGPARARALADAFG